MDWFKIGKGVHQGCILSPYLLNFYVENIIRNARLDDSQAGIKIAGRNINNLRYADDTTLITESTKEPKNLQMKVKEESEKAGLKLNIPKTKITATGPERVNLGRLIRSPSLRPLQGGCKHSFLHSFALDKILFIGSNISCSRTFFFFF